MNSDFGYLTVRTYTADQAIPISNANIEIRGADDGLENVIHFITTDSDGVSPTLELPAPVISYSLAPYPAEQPYSTYDIKISKDGYYTKIIKNVAIFSGIHADLPVNMIVFREGSDYPEGNINATITENEALEA